jgi:beta-phosphoglucomutase-like phosphatase (HAD superfamily)
VKIAVATSADWIKMDINLREIGIPVEEFDATVNGLELEKKKPHPDIFQKAAEKIGVQPANCLVVEDAVSGVQAGKRAGAKVLALTTSFSPEELDGADWFASSLADAPAAVLDW